jgi:glycosyltransferase involved in cell wall biosynthesis
MTAAATRRRVLMLCAHEPRMDPRIGWEAETAASGFDVTVLGFAAGAAKTAAPGGVYRVVRLPLRTASPLGYLWRLKDVMSPGRRLLMLALGFVGMPVLVAAKLAVRVLRLALGDARATAMMPMVVRRLFYIAGALRTQFAPACALFWPFIQAMPEKPDIVHCNDLDTLLVGVLAKKAFGCRVIFDAHEFYPVSDALCRWIDKAVFSAIERLLVARADAVVTVNPLLARAMAEAYGLRLVYSVPNAEPWTDSRAIAGTPGEMVALAAGRVRFLFQGRFADERGIREIIAAWALVDGTKAALFLRGPDNEWRRRAMAQAARLGLLDRSVFFLAAVGEERLVEAASEADVGIIPYQPIAINERLSCPNKLSQYLHAGLLVLTNDLPYVRSVLDEAKAGLWYSSADPASFASAVDRILRDPPLLRTCRENARRFARERFNWQAFGGTFLRLYAAEPAEEASRSEAVAASAVLS